LNTYVSSSSRPYIGNLVRRFFTYLKSRQQQRQEGMLDEDAQQDDISTTISRRTPTTPTTSSAPSPLPPSITTKGTTGPDGVLQLYPTLPGGKQFYVGTNPDRSRFNVSYGRNSHLPFTPKQEEEGGIGGLTFYNTTGSPISYRSGQPGGRSVRLDVYPDGGMWSNHTNHSFRNNPGYLYTPAGIASGEFTVYIRPHGSLGTHQACVWKLAGRDEDEIRSVFEIGAADAKHPTPFANWDYTHYAYHKCPTQVYSHHGRLIPERWYGMKAVRIVSPSRKFCDFHLYEDTIVNGKPANKWRLIAYAHDSGDKDMDGIVCTWKSHKDVVRVDGFQSVDFALLSTRAINVGRPNDENLIKNSPV
jgi:hypothetical protein